MWPCEREIYSARYYIASPMKDATGVFYYIKDRIWQITILPETHARPASAPPPLSSGVRLRRVVRRRAPNTKRGYQERANTPINGASELFGRLGASAHPVRPRGQGDRARCGAALRRHTGAGGRVRVRRGASLGGAVPVPSAKGALTRARDGAPDIRKGIDRAKGSPRRRRRSTLSPAISPKYTKLGRSEIAQSICVSGNSGISSARSTRAIPRRPAKQTRRARLLFTAIGENKFVGPMIVQGACFVHLKKGPKIPRADFAPNRTVASQRFVAVG